MALTPKQEKFAQCVASGMNQSAAYRAAYDCDGMGQATINNNAYVLAQNNDISMRIAELQIPIEIQVGFTLKGHIERMKSLSEKAEAKEEFGHAIKAEENVAKVLGHYVNKTELTGRGGGPVQHTITSEIIDPVEGKDDY